MKRKPIITVQCPSCKKTLEIREKREVIEPATPAVIEVTYSAVISKQTTLSSDQK